jgi:hypothetical protein
MKSLLAILLVFSIAGCEQASETLTDTKPDMPAAKTSPAPSQKNEAPQVNAPGKQTVTLLEFQEAESGIDPYQTRMLVSDDFIRVDDGGDGFVLFDRESKQIFSVLASSQRILVVDPQTPLGEAPDELTIESKLIQDDQMPMVYDKKPQYHQFSANGTHCYNVIAVNGLLPKVVEALTDYQRVLSAQQQENLNNTPPELQTPCFLANYVYGTIDYLEQGFPIEEWDDATGYRRSLIHFDDTYQVDDDIFELPEGMNLLTIGGEASIAL